MLLDDIAAALTRGERPHEKREGEGAPTHAGAQSERSGDVADAVLIHDGLPPASSGSRSLVRHLLFRCLLSPSTSRLLILSLLFPAVHFQRVIQQVAQCKEAQAPALRGLEAAAQRKLSVIDAFSHLSVGEDAPLSSSTPLDPPLSCVQRVELCTTLTLSVLETAIRSLAAASTALVGSSEGGGACVLLVDGLSSLLFHHPPSAVLAWLVSLRSIPSISLVLHADAAVPHQLLSSPHALVALERLAHTSLTVTEVRQEKLLTAPPQFRYHFSVAATHRGRRSGRLRSTAEHWTLQPSAFLLSSASDDHRHDSPDTIDAVTSTLNSLLSSSASASASSRTSPSLPQSSFNLSTSEKQRQAKAQLQLPYQHTGGRHVAVHFGEGGLQLTAAHNGAAHQHDDEDLLDDDEEDDDDDLDI